MTPIHVLHPSTRARLAIAGLVLVGGCATSNVPKTITAGEPPSDTVPAVPADSEPGVLLGLASNRAPFVLVLQPNDWPRARDSLSRLLGSALQQNEVVKRFAHAPNLLALLNYPPIDGDIDPKTVLSAWDQDRPVVISMSEPPEGGIGAAVLTAISPFSPARVNRVVLQSSEPERLAHQIAALLKKLRCKQLNLSDSASAPRSERFFRCDLFGGIARVAPAREHVRIGLVIGVKDVGLADARLGPIPTEVRRAPRTPATMLLERSTGFARLYVRTWLLQDLALFRNASMMSAALSGVSPDKRQAILFNALGELIAAQVMTSPRGAEISDITVALSPSPTPRVRAVATLTAHGKRVYRARTVNTTSRSPAPAPAGDSRVRVRTALDLDHGLREANADIGWTGNYPTDLNAFSNRVKRCGRLCGQSLMLRRPMGLLKMLQLESTAQAQRDLEQALGGDLLHIVHAPLEQGRLLELDANLGTAGAAERLQRFGVKQIVNVRAARGRVTRTRHALWAELLLHLRGSAQQEFLGPLHTNRPETAEPKHGSHAAMDCLGRTTIALALAFDGLWRPDPAQRMEMLARSAYEAQQTLGCALANHHTREEALGLQSLLTAVWMTRHFVYPTSSSDASSDKKRP